MTNGAHAHILEGRVYYSFQGLQDTGRDQGDDDMELSRSAAIKNFRDFIENFEVVFGPDEHTKSNHYRNELRRTSHSGYPVLSVDLQHVRRCNTNLADLLELKPTEYLPLFEEAASVVLRQLPAREVGDDDGAGDDNARANAAHQDVQVVLFSTAPLDQSPSMSIRDLEADRVTKMVMVTGIVTASSKPRHKATRLLIQCNHCKGTMSMACKPGMGGAFLPRVCNLSAGIPGAEKCPVDPFIIVPDRSNYVDQQTLKLQEKPEDVPTGDLPRTVMLVVDRQLCHTATPGTRVTVMGIYSTFRGKAMDKGSAATLQQPYLRVVSMVPDAGDAHSRFKFTTEEIQEFQRFAVQDNLHDEIFGRIAPNIFGSEKIKQAVAVLLFGGARKTMPDGTNRRGDINVLLLGDPSTAKSQFLKYASKVAPISVYTSGKGSSAAGLTASVVQDANSREFHLEGGAMVLADNGVVCIDEFDKMRPEDRVAIHEAMEQQTISIAKAGITTMLKSRTSVLAAANPPSGRYDDLKSAQENIDLQSTILSRFDLIFIVKDPASREMDLKIARHVLDNHRMAGARSEAMEENRQDCEFLKRYIHYCRSQCSPRLSEDAEEKLAAYYVQIRGEARGAAQREDTDSPPVPITVRQLEAVIRISEALARMALQPQATMAHVEMAIQLFTASTMDAVKSGITQFDVGNESQRGQLHRLEDKVRRRMHIGSVMTLRRLLDEMVGLGEAEPMVMRALV
ncbi:MAG: hypothetical protein WDW38_006253 [Sanguina aurantia]